MGAVVDIIIVFIIVSWSFFCVLLLICDSAGIPFEIYKKIK